MKKFKFKIRGNKYEAVINDFENNIIDIDINGTNYKVEVEPETPISQPKTPKLVRAKVPESKGKSKIAGNAPGGIQVKAPLPGNILKINVKVGDVIKAGDSLLIMEAMKMENNIQAETNGTVKAVKINEGENVLQGDVLLELE